MRGSGNTGESSELPFFPGRGAEDRVILLISDESDYKVYF